MLWITDICGCAFELHHEGETAICDKVVRTCEAHTPAEGTDAQATHDLVLAECALRQRAIGFLNEESSLAASSSDIRLADGSTKTVFIDDLDISMKPMVAMFGTTPVKKFRHSIATFHDASRVLNIVVPSLNPDSFVVLQNELAIKFGDGKVKVIVGLPEGQVTIENCAAENMTL